MYRRKLLAADNGGGSCPVSGKSSDSCVSEVVGRVTV
jgi:hypothetical protein